MTKTLRTATTSKGRAVRLDRTSYPVPGRKTPEVVWGVIVGDDAHAIYASSTRADALAAFDAWAAL